MKSEPDTVGTRLDPSATPQGQRIGASRRAFPAVQEGGSRAESPSTPSEAKPFSKAQQLARGPKRTARKRASRKEWAEIIAAKRGPCRVCLTFEGMGILREGLEYHHVVSRARLGDDVAENIVPLHPSCHRRVTDNDPHALAALAASLTDSERAYIRSKRG